MKLISTLLAIACTGLMTPVLASEFNGLNDRCQPAPTAPEQWTIRQTFNFTDRGKSYKLVYSSTNDGSGSLCLLQGTSAKSVSYKPNWYLDRVERGSAKVFNVQIHDGNGNSSPTIKYRLNLTQPQNPQFTVLKQWIMD
ncbi:hypothetical protein [Chamaesiphon polymorphus]|uniref:Uncharacterized protein n=1 Tax=Chamaesiphon polymorphus CCALA 037 TaxID=2107692 RepID=A0A2T1F7S4_9CYAN|nr:hypothetical protein [Chamaesiphon polymorphus]PSB41043.1 hypothetical protein C7B77_27745 [Chamaesiphon polymorphus CCALA 037]